MNSLVLFLLFSFFAVISISNAINCVSCVGWQNAGCNDPYDENTSGDLPVPGNTYCLKVVYPTYVERMAGGRSCTPGSGQGGSTRYCCSDQDYCNGTTRYSPSIFAVVFLLIVAFGTIFSYE